jgi:predicted glycoside hydrolase/deacetylase ChbG (UPF0249 family)
VRRLVVTADDVGLAAGMTEGALRAHDDGIVTACSVAANGRALDGALRALAARPGLAVGVHWVLTGERPLSPAREIPTLVDAKGDFLPDFRAFAWRAARGGLRHAEVELELRRQAEALGERGLVLAHANSHQHLHLMPSILPIAVGLAAELGIPALRVVREPAPGWSVPRGLEMRVLNRLGARARRSLPASLQTSVETIGIRHAGHLVGSRLEAVLRSASPLAETVELVCHPGVGAAALGAAYRWRYDWDAETAALSGPAARALVTQLGYALSPRFG